MVTSNFSPSHLQGEKEEREKSARVQNLMETTRVNRQKWIKGDSPSIDEVVNKFPHLASMKVVKLVHQWYIVDLYSSDATGVSNNYFIRE